MTTNQPDRLDRIEALLERSILESDERMTRLEQRLDESAKVSDARLTRIEQLTESNARSIQAMLDAQAEDGLMHQEFMERTEESIQRLNELIQRVNETNEGVVIMLARQEETQPTILRKLDSIEGKVDRLLEQGGDIP